MTEQEFLEKLERALNGELSPAQVQSNMVYYRGYIQEQVSGGRRAEDVLAELGDPRLIARSIVDAAVAGEERAGIFRTESGPSSGYNYREASSVNEERMVQEQEEFFGGEQTERGGFFGRSFRLSGWKATLAIALVVIVVLTILSLIFRITFRILFSPVFWLLLIGWTLWRTFRDGRGR